MLTINFVFKTQLSLWPLPLCGGKCLDLIQAVFRGVSSNVFLVVTGTNYKIKYLILPIHLNSGNCILPSAQVWLDFSSSLFPLSNRANTPDI